MANVSESIVGVVNQLRKEKICDLQSLTILLNKYFKDVGFVNDSTELLNLSLESNKFVFAFDVKDLLFKHDNDEYFLPYALLKFKGQVKTLKYYGEYFNLGEKTGYIKASIFYTLTKDAEKEKMIKYLKRII